jgi:hypothetical protein
VNTDIPPPWDPSLYPPREGMSFSLGACYPGSMTNPTEPNPVPTGCFQPEQHDLTDAELEQVLRTVQSSRFLGKLLQPDDLKRLVAELAESRPLRVLDAGDLFSQAELRVLRQDYPNFWERVHFMWATPPSQVLTALEEIPSIGPTLIVLDLLVPFRNARLPFEERRRLLQACLVHLERLHRYSYVIMSVSLPETLDAETKEFLRILANAALKTHNLVIFHATGK